MKITIDLDEQKIQDEVVSQCMRYIHNKQMEQMIGTISKQVAQEIKGDVVDSGMIDKRVEEVVKRVENSLMSRVNKQFTETMDKAMSINASAVERSAMLNMDGKAVRDHMIATLIGFQNELGCDETSEQYQAYQKMLTWVEETYGPMMS